MLRAFRWLAEIHDATAQLVLDVAVVRRRVSDLPTQLHQLERLIMTTANTLAARIDAATNEVASDLAEVREAFAALAADADAKTKAAIEAELAKLDAPIARLEALGADPADPVPAPAPVEPVVDGPAV